MSDNDWISAQNRLGGGALALFQSAIASSINAIAISDLAGNLTYVNPSFLRMWGYESADGVLGRSSLEFWSDEEKAAQVVRALFAEGSWFGELEARRKGGTQFTAELSASMITGDSGEPMAMLASFVDVTERKQAEDQLRKLYRAVEQSPSTVVITDTSGQIEYVNPKFSQLTGYSSGEVVGQNPRLLKSGEQPQYIYKGMWHTITTGEEWRGEFSNRKKSGEVYWESASISPIRNAVGEITHFVKVAEDITAQKRAEEALRQRTVELQSRNEELDAYAHTVAHDLKNPLGLVVGLAEVLETAHHALLPEELERHLHTIALNSRKMSNIVDELLLLASVRQTEVETGPLDMASIVADAQQRLSDLFQRYHAEMTAPDTWPLAWGYAPWVEEVWVNYISNALKYGGRPPRIEVGASVEEGKGMPPQVRFWVRDNGLGLKPEEQVRLFSPFTQLAQVHAEGYGLGLSIVRRIVEKLGGQVGVESQGLPHQGSVFSFTLPGRVP